MGGEERGGSGGVQYKGERAPGHEQQCGDCGGGRGHKGTKWYWKNTIKMKFKTQENIQKLKSERHI